MAESSVAGRDLVFLKKTNLNRYDLYTMKSKMD